MLRRVRHALPLLALLLVASCYIAGGDLVEYTLHVSSGLFAPDCFRRYALRVNGTMPGPTLHARIGDTLKVTVCNNMDSSGLSIHWHGLHQASSPFYDGVAGITQCAIAVGACMTYVMPLAQHGGSFFYHAHYAAILADGVYGAIVIYDAVDGMHHDDMEPHASTGNFTGNATHAVAMAGMSNSSSSHPSHSSHASSSNDTAAAAAPALRFLGHPIAGATQPSGYTELTWLVSDWFHSPSQELVAGLNGRGADYQWVGEPNSLLLNGKGTYCADAQVGSNPWQSRTTDCAGAPETMYNERSECGYPVVRVACADKLLVHIIGGTTLSYLSLSVAGHSMEVIGADGMMADAHPLTRLEVNTGERFDLLLTRDDPTTCEPNYLINVTGLYRLNQPTLFAALNYVDAPLVASIGVDPFDQPVSTFPNATSFPMPATLSQEFFPQTLGSVPTPQLEDAPLSFLRSLMHGPGGLAPVVPPAALLAAPDKRLLLVGQHQRIDGRMRWTINGVANEVPPTPSYFLSLLNYTGGASSRAPLSPVRAARDSAMIDIELGSWVEIILQNTVSLSGICEQHGWHLHGMHAYVFDSGVGTYRAPSPEAESRLNSSRRILAKDSFTVYPRLDPAVYPNASRQVPFKGTPGDGCGWLALRVHATNAGVWLLHCHNLWHSMMGMGVVLHVKSATQPLPPLPDDADLCGEPAVLYADPNNLRVLRPALFAAAEANATSTTTTTTSSTSATTIATDDTNSTTTSTDSTTTMQWYDYIGPTLIVFVVMGAIHAT